MAPKHPKIQGFSLVEEIGGGGFATVYRAVNIATHQVAACKVILLKPDTPTRNKKLVDTEIRIHRSLGRHRNVLELFESVVVDLKYAEKYIPGVYILLEMAAGGDLFDKIAPDVGVGEEVGQHYFQQLVAGMEYIHKKGICHRDLKPENILLDAAGTLKVSDFGLSAIFLIPETGATKMLRHRCGSMPYIAPEVRDDNTYEAPPVDIWGMGVILFTMLVGNTPWDQATLHSPEFCRYVQNEIFDDDPWNRLSYDVLMLIRGLLTVDPDTRMTMETITESPWCTSPSQLKHLSSSDIAQRLTQTLRQSGDLDVATPSTALVDSDFETDEDGDSIMAAATQFTQSLMLFSQTQSGARYTPHLTRFYASLDPVALFPILQHALETMGVNCRRFDVPLPNEKGLLRLRLKGMDARLTEFKGWLNVERFSKKTGHEGSFCILMRELGSPISWRQLWKALIQDKDVSPHVFRR